MEPDYIASRSDRTAKTVPLGKKVPFRPCFLAGWLRCGHDEFHIPASHLKLWVFSDVLLYRGSGIHAGLCACREEIEKS